MWAMLTTGHSTSDWPPGFPIRLGFGMAIQFITPATVQRRVVVRAVGGGRSRVTMETHRPYSCALSPRRQPLSCSRTDTGYRRERPHSPCTSPWRTARTSLAASSPRQHRTILNENTGESGTDTAVYSTQTDRSALLFDLLLVFRLLFSKQNVSITF